MTPETITDCILCGRPVYRDTNWERVEPFPIDLEAPYDHIDTAYLCADCVTGNDDWDLLEHGFTIV